MVISCWSAKGGAGTTVAAAGLALTLGQAAPASPARPLDRPEVGALLVDAAGDLPAVLGLADVGGPGVADWLAAGPDVPLDGLAMLEVEVVPGVSLLRRGDGPLEHPDRAEVLAAILAAESRHVVIDCGCLAGFGTGSADAEVRRVLTAAAHHSVLVTRPCYLALRRAVHSPVRPDGVILVAEPGRSLRAEDVAAVVAAPVLTTLPWDSAIARAVDAGLLASRLPRQLARALARAA